MSPWWDFPIRQLFSDQFQFRTPFVVLLGISQERIIIQSQKAWEIPSSEGQ